MGTTNSNSGTCTLGSECSNAHAEIGVCCEINGRPVCDPSESCLRRFGADTVSMACVRGSECLNENGQPGICRDIDGKPRCDSNESSIPPPSNEFLSKSRVRNANST